MASTHLTRADSIRAYLTGAASDGGAQTDPNAALGNFRSSTIATTYGISITGAIANLTVDYASGYNAVGAGSLDCTGVSTIRWKDAGGTYGTAVTILNGETQIVEAAGSAGAFILVTRASATDLVVSTATVTLALQANNLWGFDDVTGAEAAAGDAEYRGTIIKNVSANTVTLLKMWIKTLGTQRTTAGGQLGASGAGTITISSGTFADWPTTGWAHIKTNAPATREIVYYSSRTDTVLTVPANGRARLGTSAAAGAATDTVDAVPGVAIGIDTAGVTAAAAIQTIANEGTAPTSVTFNTNCTAALGLAIGTMTTLQQVGVWIWRDVPTGQYSNPSVTQPFNISFDAP